VISAFGLLSVRVGDGFRRAAAYRAHAAYAVHGYAGRRLISSAPAPATHALCPTRHKRQPPLRVIEDGSQSI
jgi:hypothetical protein